MTLFFAKVSPYDRRGISGPAPYPVTPPHLLPIGRVPLHIPPHVFFYRCAFHFPHNRRLASDPFSPFSPLGCPAPLSLRPGRSCSLKQRCALRPACLLVRLRLSSLPSLWAVPIVGQVLSPARPGCAFPFVFRYMILFDPAFFFSRMSLLLRPGRRVKWVFFWFVFFFCFFLGGGWLVGVGMSGD